MKTLSKRLIAVALSGALLVPTIATAEAGPKRGWQGHHHGGYHYNPTRHRKSNNVGAAVAAGVIGLAAGAILLGAANRPAYAGPPPPPPATYYPPAPYPGQVHGAVGYQPWSPAWYQYCSSKFRSFTPSTGTYTTSRGAQRFCQ